MTSLSMFVYHEAEAMRLQGGASRIRKGGLVSELRAEKFRCPTLTAEDFVEELARNRLATTSTTTTAINSQ